MAFEKIGGDIVGDFITALIERGEIAAALLGGDFVADVHQLAQVRIELWIFRVMAEGGGHFDGVPMFDNITRGQSRLVDGEHGCVGRA